MLGFYFNVCGGRGGGEDCGASGDGHKMRVQITDSYDFVHCQTGTAPRPASLVISVMWAPFILKYYCALYRIFTTARENGRKVRAGFFFLHLFACWSVFGCFCFVQSQWWEAPKKKCNFTWVGWELICIGERNLYFSYGFVCIEMLYRRYCKLSIFANDFWSDFVV